MNRAINILKQVWNPLHYSIRSHAYPAHFTQYLGNLACTQYTKLANGLTIATEERACYNACIALLIDAGSRYENVEENGITHFFEHIAFKGTKSRPKNELEALMSSIGAKFRCFMTREMVVYYVECMHQDTPLAVDLLTDCIFNNAFSPKEINYQKKIVYAEMRALDKNPKAVVYDYLHSTAFQGTPLARTVMGPSSNLHSFNESTLSKYLTKSFNPCKMVMAAVGGIKHEQMVNLANCYLSKSVPAECYRRATYRYTGSDVRYRDDSMPTCHVMAAVEGPRFGVEEHIVMEVARHIVGGWDRSQPGGDGHHMRVARTATVGKYCDAYQAFNIAYKDCGLWGVHFLSNVTKLDDMMLLVQNEFMYLCLCITKPELERAKCFLKAMIVAQIDSSLETCLNIGRWTLYHGCTPSPVQLLQVIDCITVDQVRTVCQRFLYDRCPVIAAVGPTEGLFDYGRIRAGMWWIRY